MRDTLPEKILSRTIIHTMIRPANHDDFDFVYHLYMHPAVNPFLLYELMDRAHFSPIFDALIADQVLYIFSAENEAVGMFKLIQLKHRTSHIAYLGGLAIDPLCGGHGHGLGMMAAIIELGRSRKLKRIELSTDANNSRALRLYEKCGFQREGVLRNYTYLQSEDRYIDEVLLSYLYAD